MSAPETSFVLPEVTKQAVEFLRHLIRFNTTNPPGDELECARWIAGVFGDAGIGAEVLEPAPGRGSVVARIKGNGSKRPLLLLSHLDVVPAVAADWEHDPFGGELIDGEIWGRGALDMKSLTAIWMVLFLAVKRLGVRLDRDLIFFAAADEEMMGTWGAKWVAENRPELVAAEYALNEGGGEGRTVAGRTLYTYQPAEKGVCWLKLTARGTAGHASMPHDDNPVVHLAQALAKIGARRLPLHVTETFRQFVERVRAALPGQLGEAMKLLLDDQGSELALQALSDDYLAGTIRAMSRNTAAPTCLQASTKTNVIPAAATAEVDCRLLPGQTPEDLLGELRAVVGLKGEPGEKLQIEIIRTNPASESPPDTELTRVIEKVLARHAPGTALVPFLMPGATDSRFFRPKGTVCYGFHPMLPDIHPETVHGKNERIPVSSLEFGLRVLWDVVTEMATPRDGCI